MKKIILLTTLALAVLAMSGCFRKSIDSSPPSRQPTSQEASTSANEQTIISETHNLEGNEPVVIEKTHNKEASHPKIIDDSYDVQSDAYVDAAEIESDNKVMPDIGGDDLAEEPLPESEQAAPTAAETAKEDIAKTTEIAANDPVAKEAFEPAADPEDEVVATETPKTADQPVAAETGEYYVQVGAFSDLENANKVLAGLLSEGYKGSMLVKTETGMYRVHAGAFADSEAASKALENLKPVYPNGYVLKAE